MKNKLIILRGLPGSGKTKFANFFLQSHPNYKRVNQQDLLDMMGNYPIGGVGEVELATIDLLLDAGNGVIVDDVNESETRLDELKDIACLNNVEYVVHLFKTPLPVCLENSKFRLSGVSASKIKSLFDNYFKRLYA